MKLAIIGASGFIGLRAAEWFQLGGHAEVRAIVRSFASLAVLARQELDWRVADPLDARALAEAIGGCDAVLHAAIGDARQIVQMAAVAAEACAAAKVPRLVWLSSASVHGQAPAADTDENTPLRDDSDFAYNNAKVRAERVLEQCRDVQIVRLRPGVVIGPRSRWIADAAAQLRAGTAWWVTEGRGVCNSVYVDNLLEAVRLAITAPAATGEAFLISDAEVVTWRDLLLPIAASLDLDVSAFHAVTPAEIPPHQRAPAWDSLMLSSPATWLAARVSWRAKRVVKSVRAGWIMPPPPVDGWTLPSAPRPQPDAEMGALLQCEWKFPNAKAARVLGYAPPVSFEEGLRRSPGMAGFRHRQMTPVFTICIPAFQAEGFLAETLATVKAQTYPHWVLVVTEDGSRDGTEKIVRAFAATVRQEVRYERHDPNRGLPATRNAAIERAGTEWIALLDADDLWLPEHLAGLAETVALTGADLVHAGSVLFESASGAVLELRRPDAATVADFPQSLHDGRYIIQPASVAFRREIWDRAGRFDASFRYVEDWDMWMRCARAGGKFAYTGKETCRYRRHATALSTHGVPMAVACARALEKQLDWESIAPGRRCQAVAEHWAAAGRMTLRGAPGEAHLHYTRALARQFRVSWWLRRLAAGLLASGGGRA